MIKEIYPYRYYASDRSGDIDAAISMRICDSTKEVIKDKYGKVIYLTYPNLAIRLAYNGNDLVNVVIYSDEEFEVRK